MASPITTRLCALLGVEYPVVQTGMGWVAGPHLVSAVAQAGGLGILASATMSLIELESAIREVKDRTDKPFGVNLRSDAHDVADRISAMGKAEVRVASFAQAPSRALIERCHDAGLVVIPTVGARRHAEKVAELGVDAVIAQGQEGGGHTGLVPTSLLIPQVVDAVGEKVVVIAAGGFFDGRGLIAALAYGAHGVAMGTRFLLTSDSRVPEVIKNRYLQTNATGTVVTRRIDGAPQRVISTSFVDSLEREHFLRALLRAMANAHRFKSETGTTLFSMLKEGRRMKRSSTLTWPQVMMAANAPVMTKAALVDGNPDVGVFPTGQVVGLIDSLPSARDVLKSIVAEAEDLVSRLANG